MIEFCTCSDRGCPNHPDNHDCGCSLCIEKNLTEGEIPTCFFKKIDPNYAGPDYYYRDFAELVMRIQKDK